MDTRGILRPAAVDRIFGLERTPPPAELTDAVIGLEELFGADGAALAGAAAQIEEPAAKLAPLHAFLRERRPRRRELTRAGSETRAPGPAGVG